LAICTLEKAMKSIPPLLLVAIMAVATLGVLSGIYALLTRERRRTMHEIEAEVSRRGWEFHLRQWLGDSTAFRIDGWSRNGLTWVLKTGPGSSDTYGWAVGLGLHFPRLVGEMDLAIFPREKGGGSSLLAFRLSHETQARVAAFSAVAANAAAFFRDARETPSGLPAFEPIYQILALQEGTSQNPIDAALAERILQWPAEAIAPKEVLAWRDPFGCHFHAHLPQTPNWTTITHFLAIAEDLCARLPAPVTTTAPRSF
jgi:hypothetical protein